MKKPIRFLKGTAIALALLTSGCSDDLALDNTQPTAALPEDDGITYPHSPSFHPTVLSRSGSSFEEDWENWQTYECPAGPKLDMPWANNVEGSVQDNIKKKDGWIMVFHNFNSVAVPNHYFMGFYNEFSGELKYLFRVTSVSPHTTCTPKMGITSDDVTVPQALLNTTGELSISASQTLDDLWVHAGLQNSDQLLTGWNCVDMPLSYDPQFPDFARLTVDPSKAVTTSASSFIENSKSETEGSIISMTSSGDNYSGAIAKLVGNKAKGWLEKTFGNAMGNILTGGVTSLVKSGIHLLTGSLFGSHKSEQVQQVRLTTKTTGRITGTTTTSTTTGASKISVRIDKNVIGRELGSWNLTENPTIYMHPIGVLYSAPYGTISDENEYKFRNSNKYKVDVVINPELLSKLTKYWVKCEPVLYFPDNTTTLPVSPAKTIQTGSLNDLSMNLGHYYDMSKLVGTLNGTTVYRTQVSEIWTSISLWDKFGKPSGDNPVYKYIYAPGGSEYIRGMEKISSRNLYAKVSLYMVRELDGKADTLVHTRTYQPKLEWDPDIVRVCTYPQLNMQYVQYRGSIDPLLAEIDNKCWENLGNGQSPLLKIEEEDQIESEEETEE